MAKRFFILLLTFNCTVFIAQNLDSIPQKANVIKLDTASDTLFLGQEQPKQKAPVINDTINSDIKTVEKVTITPIKDTTAKEVVDIDDRKFATQVDKMWFQELYNNTMFDTIYKSVEQLNFDSVYYPELPTDILKSRLKELDAKTPFNITYNPALESVIKSYLKNRRKHLQKLIMLSGYYFPMFERELDNHNIPLEIKYLAVVESALKPRAKSRVGATGLWQFMFATGKMYGLDVSSYVDERSDPIKSTEAAAKYLAKLYKIFGDWDLALAAYNSGPGNVSKAIRRSGGYKNYWNIRPNLPRETAGYLPAFLANMYIFEYAEEHGFKKIKPQFSYIETDTLRVKHMITLDQVAEVTSVPIEELQFLNPSYKLDIIPFIKGKNYTLRLPRHAVGNFVNSENEIYAFAKAEFNKREKPLPQLFNANNKVTYRVKSGDYLGKISRIYGVRVSQLKRWNGLRSNNLKIGQRIIVYPRKPVIATKSKPQPKVAIKPINGPVTTYKVKNGDSLWSISQQFKHVTIQNIKEWNGISGTKLKPGMELKITKK